MIIDPFTGASRNIHKCLTCVHIIHMHKLYLQETFESGLATFQQEGIGGLSAMKEQLEKAEHPQSRAIRDRHTDVMRR